MARKAQEKKVRIRLLPLKGIGGIGNAGDTAWMTPEEAEQWVKDGYVEIIPDADEPVPSTAADVEVVEEEKVEPAEEEAEDHAIMKPQRKRRK